MTQQAQFATLYFNEGSGREPETHTAHLIGGTWTVGPSAELMSEARRVVLEDGTVLKDRGSMQPPSDIVISLARAWGDGNAMLMTEVGALTRWAANRCESLVPAERVSHISDVLGLSTPKARLLCQHAGFYAGQKD